MRSTVGDKDAGRRLCEYLASRFTYHTGSEWARLVADGRVCLHGSPAAAEAVLRAGDEVCYDASGIPEPPADEAVDVVVDDPLFYAMNKSGNLTCHPGGRYFNRTLWALLKTRYGLAEPILVNRIDRETSGLVLVGKTPEAAQNLWKQFAGHTVVKRYTVFVEGVFPARVEAEGWLSKDAASAIRKKRGFAPAERGGAAPCAGAEWCETSFERVRVAGGFSVVTALPRTGRLHQIRATLLSLGYPVVGDKLYGVDEALFLRFCQDALTEEDRQRLRLRRQALHAGYLRFRHPGSGELTELVAPLPPDMAALL